MGKRQKVGALPTSWCWFFSPAWESVTTTRLEELIHCYSALRHFERAIAYTHRWLAVDRLHESAYRQLMLLYTWTGQRTSALHQNRERLQVLDRELWVATLEETAQLYQHIRAGTQKLRQG